MTRQIVISEEVYSELMSLKVHPREPFNDVIKRLLAFYRAQQERIGNSGGEIGEPQKDTDEVTSGTNQTPKVTEEVKAEPPKGVAEATEPEKPEFPKGFPKEEVPLAGVPSSEKPKETPVDFSWATRKEKLRELVVRWVDVFRKWDTKELVNTFRRCKGDDPTREAVIIVMKERFEMKLPETEKATIRNFFKDDEVMKFMEEHGIEGIKEGVPAEDKPAEGPEKKEEGG
jgi:predicted CopG family antitoxin